MGFSILLVRSCCVGTSIVRFFRLGSSFDDGPRTSIRRSLEAY
jgi:hypothetical protein